MNTHNNNRKNLNTQTNNGQNFKPLYLFQTASPSSEELPNCFSKQQEVCGRKTTTFRASCISQKENQRNDTSQGHNPREGRLSAIIVQR